MQYGRSLGRGQVLNPFDGGEDATRLAVIGRYGQTLTGFADESVCSERVDLLLQPGLLCSDKSAFSPATYGSGESTPASAVGQARGWSHYGRFTEPLQVAPRACSVLRVQVTVPESP